MRCHIQLGSEEFHKDNVFLKTILPTYTIKMDFKLKKNQDVTEVQPSIFNQRGIIKIRHLLFRDYNYFMQSTSIFCVSQVFEKLTDKQFHGPLWSVSLF